TETELAPPRRATRSDEKHEIVLVLELGEPGAPVLVPEPVHIGRLENGGGAEVAEGRIEVRSERLDVCPRRRGHRDHARRGIRLLEPSTLLELPGEAGGDRKAELVIALQQLPELCPIDLEELAVPYGLDGRRPHGAGQHSELADCGPGAEQPKHSPP